MEIPGLLFYFRHRIHLYDNTVCPYYSVVRGKRNIFCSFQYFGSVGFRKEIMVVDHGCYGSVARSVTSLHLQSFFLHIAFQIITFQLILHCLWFVWLFRRRCAKVTIKTKENHYEAGGWTNDLSCARTEKFPSLIGLISKSKRMGQ